MSGFRCGRSTRQADGPSLQLVTKTVGRAREGTAMAAPLTAPRTSFNGTITGHRAIGLAEMSLDDIKEIKPRPGPRSTTSSSLSPGRAALLPRGPRRAAERVVARDGAGLGARHLRARRGREQGVRAVHQARHRHRRPAGAARRHVHGQPERQGPPQRDQRRLPAGLGRVRRAADVRPCGARLRRPAARRAASWSCTTW